MIAEQITERTGTISEVRRELYTGIPIFLEILDSCISDEDWAFFLGKIHGHLLLKIQNPCQEAPLAKKALLLLKPHLFKLNTMPYARAEYQRGRKMTEVLFNRIPQN